MTVKIIYCGQLWEGSTSQQRFNALDEILTIKAVKLDFEGDLAKRPSIWQRVRWRLRWPSDIYCENRKLIAACLSARPDAIVVDNSKVIRLSTIKKVRKIGVKCIAYYTPDDVVSRHNLSWPLRISLRHWDLFFTTKTFNVPELGKLGVRSPVLIGKAFDPHLHRPLAATEVGEEFERYDVVFAGAYERQRCASINALAAAGVSAIVYGAGVGGWRQDKLHPSVVLRQATFGRGYCLAMHHGKIALGFLRKLNRDQITQRSVEIAAMGRPMLAEKTEEHDEHFADGQEYIGFISDEDLILRTKALLVDIDGRAQLGSAARQRCLDSGYSTSERARFMVQTINQEIASI